MSPDMSARVAAVMRAKARRLLPVDAQRDQHPWLFALALADRLEDTGTMADVRGWALDLAYPVKVVSGWYHILAAHKLLGGTIRRELEPHPAIIGEVLRAARSACPVA